MQEIFQPWILDTTLGTIASGTFIRLWSIRGGMLCEGDGILISQYIYIYYAVTARFKQQGKLITNQG